MEFSGQPELRTRFHESRLNILIGIIGVLGNILEHHDVPPRSSPNSV
jgi:hypothetical protein